MSTYDLVILGAGPAGMTAGIYAARAGLKAVLIEKALVGGQVATTYSVENYPGFPEPIPGPELVNRMQQQLDRFGAPILMSELERIIPQNKQFLLQLNQQELICSALIIATGASPAILKVPGEGRLRGRGVSYCATCDGPLFRDEPIAVAGGGNSAVEEAVYLARFAKSVSLIHRRDALRADKYIQEMAFAEPKLHFIWDTVVEEILGGESVAGLRLRNKKTGKVSVLDISGLFIYVGLQPNTQFLTVSVPEDAGTPCPVKLDEHGFIITDRRFQTSCPGIFAAGDVLSKDVRQIANAVGEAASAAIMARKYIEQL